MVGRGIVRPDEATENGRRRLEELRRLPPTPPLEHPAKREAAVRKAREESARILGIDPDAPPDVVHTARKRLAERFIDAAPAGSPPQQRPSPSEAPGIRGRVAETLRRVIAPLRVG